MSARAPQEPKPQPLGLWAHGPVIRDSTSLTFVARCLEHDQFAFISTEPQETYLAAQAHWGQFHEGRLPSRVELPDLQEVAA